MRPLRPGLAGPGLVAPKRVAVNRPKAPAQKPAVPVVAQPKEIPATIPLERDPEPTPEVAASADGGATVGGTGASGDGIVGGGGGGEGGGGAASRERVDFDDTMTAPKLLDGPSIEYSIEALQQRIEGLMVVRCVVTVEGTVYGCRVLKSLPFMDEAVVSVLQARRYKPAMLNDVPLEVNYTFRIKLRLPR